MSEAELMVNIILLLLAGHETTVNLIANGILALARYPAEFERLREDPSLVRSAIEEVLRFYPPVHLRPRLPLEDIELSTGTVPAYADLFLVVAAANRDPANSTTLRASSSHGPTTAIWASGSASITASGAPLRSRGKRYSAGSLNAFRGSSSYKIPRLTRTMSHYPAWLPWTSS